MSLYTFNQLQEALSACTSYYLRQVKDEDGELAYALLDGCGDQDGDLFDDLEEVAYYICNNVGVSEYLTELATLEQPH
jgi:hypothetical protein